MDEAPERGNVRYRFFGPNPKRGAARKKHGGVGGGGSTGNDKKSKNEEHKSFGDTTKSKETNGSLPTPNDAAKTTRHKSFEVVTGADGAVDEITALEKKELKLPARAGHVAHTIPPPHLRQW